MASSDSGVESNADMDVNVVNKNRKRNSTTEQPSESRNAVASPSESTASELSDQSPDARRRRRSINRRRTSSNSNNEDAEDDEHGIAEEDDVEEEEGDVEDDDVDEEMEVSQEDDDEPYRHRLSVEAETASIGRQTPPRDLIVCGLCRQEFQLSNFADFIEHKVAYCHNVQKKLDADSPSSYSNSFGRSRRKRTGHASESHMMRSLSANVPGKEVATETEERKSTF